MVEYDDVDIHLAHKYRLSLSSSPSQSSFRVLAIVFYELQDESSSSDVSTPMTTLLHQAQDKIGEPRRHHVVGTNDEPCYIGGSICAERAAMVQLRFLPNLRRITKVVISTDCEAPVSPGMLCREFFASHPKVPWDVPIVLVGSICQCCHLDISSNRDEVSASSSLVQPCPRNNHEQHKWTTIRTTLEQLYPHPSPYVRLGAKEAAHMGECIAVSRKTEDDEQGEKLQKSSGSNVSEQVWPLLKQAIEASKGDSRIDLHPIHYGAAVLFSDDSSSSACQKKALEYGCTLDAVTQLAPAIDAKRKCGIQPVLLVQVDQFGVVHPPFAPARAFLSEHGYGNCNVLVPRPSYEISKSLVEVPASELAPGAPNIGHLWRDN